MTVVYGNLPKSQTDAETIEEMIDRKISEHEASPTAHMGTGESIDVHRKTDIVDHLAGSVLNDKFTMTEFYWSENFKDLVNWYISGSSDHEGNMAILYTESGDTEETWMFKEFFYPQPFFTKNRDFLVQFLMQADLSNTNYKFYGGMGTFEAQPVAYFVGFEIHNGVTKGVAINGATRLETSSISNDLSKEHIYRIQHIKGENKFYYYIDGQLRGEISNTLTDWNTDGGPYIGYKLTGTNDGRILILDVQCSRGVL